MSADDAPYYAVEWLGRHSVQLACVTPVPGDWFDKTVVIAIATRDPDGWLLEWTDVGKVHDALAQPGKRFAGWATLLHAAIEACEDDEAELALAAQAIGAARFAEADSARRAQGKEPLGGPVLKDGKEAHGRHA